MSKALDPNLFLAELQAILTQEPENARESTVNLQRKIQNFADEGKTKLKSPATMTLREVVLLFKLSNEQELGKGTAPVDHSNVSQSIEINGINVPIFRIQPSWSIPTFLIMKLAGMDKICPGELSEGNSKFFIWTLLHNCMEEINAGRGQTLLRPSTPSRRTESHGSAPASPPQQPILYVFSQTMADRLRPSSLSNSILTAREGDSRYASRSEEGCLSSPPICPSTISDVLESGRAESSQHTITTAQKTSVSLSDLFGYAEMPISAIDDAPDTEAPGKTIKLKVDGRADFAIGCDGLEFASSSVFLSAVIKKKGTGLLSVIAQNAAYMTISYKKRVEEGKPSVILYGMISDSDLYIFMRLGKEGVLSVSPTLQYADRADDIYTYVMEILSCCREQSPKSKCSPYRDTEALAERLQDFRMHKDGKRDFEGEELFTDVSEGEMLQEWPDDIDD